MPNPEKTNAMRILDRLKVAYSVHRYDGSPEMTGAEIASMLGENAEKVFKTLVTRSNSGGFFVFMVPVERELDLKKAAKAAGVKSIEMVKSKELFPLTGYVHGGCSPVGMKKQFPTFIDISAVNFDSIMFSGGKIGCQLEASPTDLKKAVNFTAADICLG